MPSLTAPPIRPRRHRWLAFFGLTASVAALVNCSAPEPPPLRPPAAYPTQMAPPVAVPVGPATPPPAVAVQPPAPVPTVVPTAPPVEPPPPAAPTNRVYAPVGLITIHSKPDRDAPVIGGFRAGQSIELKETELPPERQQRRLYKCSEGWYPVLPRGWVCVGGAEHATRDGNDVRVIAAAAALPDPKADYPFKYGVSIGAPQYLRIPTPAEQRIHEPNLDTYRQSAPPSDPGKGGTVSFAPAGVAPPATYLKYLKVYQPELKHEQEAYDGYKIAWTREFDAAGRTWLLTADMMLVPKDKVRVKPLPTLKGIDLKKNPVNFPIAFTWLGDAPRLIRNEEGKLVESADKWPRHTFIPATMTMVRENRGKLYWKMADGSFANYHDVSMIRASAQRPPGVRAEDKWVEARITWGYLIAYEGDKPVYVTAMSPGMDGVNPRQHATARGKHHIKWKLLTGDMSGADKGKDWFVDEVPWIQYYKGNYAFHGAWWHNDFGRPKSHGCINLSPPDARALFHWMDPVIPEGWYAASAYYPFTRGTTVFIRS